MSQGSKRGNKERVVLSGLIRERLADGVQTPEAMQALTRDDMRPRDL
jgi:hypothetical protein